MSINDTYDDDTDESGDIPALRAAAKRAKALERENATMKRENAFLRAGITMDDPKMSYFVRGYDGDLDPEAIRTAALDAGFIQAQQDTGQTAQVVEGVQAEARVVQAAAGAATNDVSEQAAAQRLEDAFKQGGVEAMLAAAASLGIPVDVQ